MMMGDEFKEVNAEAVPPPPARNINVTIVVVFILNCAVKTLFIWCALV